MPPKPKKKRTPASNVVGTVSTRSTRRQSIVNIDIPRSSKSTSKVQKEKKTNPLPPPPAIITKPVAVARSRGRPKKNVAAVVEILEEWSDQEADEDSKEGIILQPFLEINKPQKMSKSKLKGKKFKGAVRSENVVENIASSSAGVVVKTENVEVESDINEVASLAGVSQIELIVEGCAPDSNDGVVYHKELIGIDSEDDEIVIECVTEEIIYVDDSNDGIIFDNHTNALNNLLIPKIEQVNEEEELNITLDENNEDIVDPLANSNEEISEPKSPVSLPKTAQESSFDDVAMVIEEKQENSIEEIHFSSSSNEENSISTTEQEIQIEINSESILKDVVIEKMEIADPSTGKSDKDTTVQQDELLDELDKAIQENTSKEIIDLDIMHTEEKQDLLETLEEKGPVSESTLCSFEKTLPEVSVEIPDNAIEETAEDTSKLNPLVEDNDVTSNLILEETPPEYKETEHVLETEEMSRTKTEEEFKTAMDLPEAESTIIEDTNTFGDATNFKSTSTAKETRNLELSSNFEELAETLDDNKMDSLEEMLSEGPNFNKETYEVSTAAILKQSEIIPFEKSQETSALKSDKKEIFLQVNIAEKDQEESSSVSMMEKTIEESLAEMDAKDDSNLVELETKIDYLRLEDNQSIENKPHINKYKRIKQDFTEDVGIEMYSNVAADKTKELEMKIMDLKLQDTKNLEDKKDLHTCGSNMDDLKVKSTAKHLEDKKDLITNESNIDELKLQDTAKQLEDKRELVTCDSNMDDLKLQDTVKHLEDKNDLLTCDSNMDDLKLQDTVKQTEDKNNLLTCDSNMEDLKLQDSAKHQENKKDLVTCDSNMDDLKLQDNVKQVEDKKDLVTSNSNLDKKIMEEAERRKELDDAEKKVLEAIDLIEQKSRKRALARDYKSTKQGKDKKSSKTSKTKEPKSQKEPKTKKPSTPTKKSKTDKKESSKKLSKAQKQQQEDDENAVRRSSRIKSIIVSKKRTTGHGLVRSKSESYLNDSDISENSNSGFADSEKPIPASPKVTGKEPKIYKSRWSKSTDNVNVSTQSPAEPSQCKEIQVQSTVTVEDKPKLAVKDKEVEARLKQFLHLRDNLYLTDRMTCKEAKKMSCDCFLTEEDLQRGEFGCGEDCLNRLLMIECGNLCPVSERCTNKRFQKAQFAPVEVFKTEKKGLGLRAAANIPYGDFILEYVGEVLDPEEFDQRAEEYSVDKNIHYYFMSLRADAIIDATMKGNISRFINHSCDPNAETQKWTVNGELRIGFFSTRTILAGEEITFDYRFQRYGKEAQKCYCEAATCRGWLGDEPDEDSEEEDEEEDLEDVELKKEDVSDLIESKGDPEKPEETKEKQEVTVENKPAKSAVSLKRLKPRSPRKKPRKDIFEDIDQLDEEIDMLITTGLKNQAHTLKLSRLMVRAKEAAQRTKLLRILRRGELPCRRLFLDYHGLRLMHGYMIDAQHLVHTDNKFESLRLEMLQTLATLPIPNKSMLQDSKVLSTVETWSMNKDLGSPLDSDSNSPKTEDVTPPIKPNEIKITTEGEEAGVGPTVSSTTTEIKKEAEDSQVNYLEEILALALKLLEEWRNLKEVFRIPKKERIEQMKEHEREANKKFIASGYGAEPPDAERKIDRYRFARYNKNERDLGGNGGNRKGKFDDRRDPFAKLSKYERRKIFALQVELKEEERRLKQREMWRQHEQNCMMIGTDPRFTAPFDPSRGFQCIWNPQIGQWQNYPLPQHNQAIFNAQPLPPPSVNMGISPLPNVNIPPPHVKNVPNYPYNMVPNVSPMGIPTSMAGPMIVPGQNLMQLPSPLPPPTPVQMQINYQQESIKIEEDPSQVQFMGPIPPPVALPPKWKCANDKYGRPYYYHVKIRMAQWEPPPFTLPSAEDLGESSDTTSSSDTSSLSSDSSSENSDSDDEIDDTRLLIEVRKQMEKSAKGSLVKEVVPVQVKVEVEEEETPSPEDEIVEDAADVANVAEVAGVVEDDLMVEEKESSIDVRLKEQFNFGDEDKPPSKKRRVGLVQEIIISPRTEEDRLQFREDLKRYKQNKEKLKKQKEMILQQTRKQLREIEPKKTKEKHPRTTLKSKIKEMPDFNTETARKIKESFRTNMATVVVSVLNSYRKPDCKEGRITNTEEFKHLARKLTHFVMLKEIKHIAKIEDLVCTDNVKSKAREYIRKYMAKFGDTYQKRSDEPDFKD